MDNDDVSVKTLLLFLCIGLGLSMAGCKAKCLPGYAKQGSSCKRVGADTPAVEMEVPATAGGGANAGTPAVAPSELAAGDGANGTVPSQQSAAGTGAAAPNSSAASMMEACSVEESTRCAPSPQGARDTCTGGAWVSMAPCNAGEACVVTDDKNAGCAAVEKLCKGSSGQPVCDGQGMMLLCNDDGTVRSQEMCASLRLCQAGISIGKCPACHADEDYRCVNTILEVCAGDATGFVALTECETASLCNPVAGMCTAAACVPDAFSCDNNTLKVCNPDATGFDESRSMPCGSGTCDAKGGDCNMCEPGHKMCSGDSVAVCDETGQTFQEMPCGGELRCEGAGNCVECKEDSDCSGLTKDCVVGACVQSKCTPMNAARGTECRAGSRPGTCSNGTCECTKQCDKPCGEDGCGAMCPDQCGSMMCVNDECVECRTNADCNELTSQDRCTVGVCRNGDCDTMEAGAISCTVAGSSGTRGTCSRGECQCTPDCAAVCGGPDGCSGRCPNTCSSSETCGDDYKCHPKPTHNYVPCPSQSCVGETACTQLGYCSGYCTNNNGCLTGQLCLPDGFCAFRPPCGDMVQTTWNGTNVCRAPGL
jgi:hypothetical protein